MYSNPLTHSRVWIVAFCQYLKKFMLQMFLCIYVNHNFQIYIFLQWLKNPKMSASTRSKSSVQLGAVQYVDLESLFINPLSGTGTRQAPTGVAVLGRVAYLTKQFDEVGQRITKAKAYRLVTE